MLMTEKAIIIDVLNRRDWLIARGAVGNFEVSKNLSGIFRACYPFEFVTQFGLITPHIGKPLDNGLCLAAQFLKYEQHVRALIAKLCDPSAMLGGDCTITGICQDSLATLTKRLYLIRQMFVGGSHDGSVDANRQTRLRQHVTRQLIQSLPVLVSARLQTLNLHF
jgi:hypothetical protein